MKELYVELKEPYLQNSNQTIVKTTYSEINHSDAQYKNLNFYLNIELDTGRQCNLKLRTCNKTWHGAGSSQPSYKG